MASPQNIPQAFKPLAISIPDPALASDLPAFAAGMPSAGSPDDHFVTDVFPSENSPTALLRLSTQYLSSEEALSPTEGVSSDADDSDAASLLSLLSEPVKGKAVKVQIARLGGTPQMICLSKPTTPAIRSPPTLSSTTASTPALLSTLTTASATPTIPPSRTSSRLVANYHYRVGCNAPAPAITFTPDLDCHLAHSPAGSSTDLHDPGYTDAPLFEHAYPPQEPARRIHTNRKSHAPPTRNLSAAVSKLKNRASIAAVWKLSRSRQSAEVPDLSSLSVESHPSPVSHAGPASHPDPSNLFRYATTGSTSLLDTPLQSTAPSSQQSTAASSQPSLKSKASGKSRFRHVSRSILAAVTLSSSSTQSATPVSKQQPAKLEKSEKQEKKSHARRLSLSLNKAFSVPRPSSSANPLTQHSNHERRSSMANLSLLLGSRRNGSTTPNDKLKPSADADNASTPSRADSIFAFRRLRQNSSSMMLSPSASNIALGSPSDSRQTRYTSGHSPLEVIPDQTPVMRPQTSSALLNSPNSRSSYASSTPAYSRNASISYSVLSAGTSFQDNYPPPTHCPRPSMAYRNISSPLSGAPVTHTSTFHY